MTQIWADFEKRTESVILQLSFVFLASTLENHHNSQKFHKMVKVGQMLDLGVIYIFPKLHDHGVIKAYNAYNLPGAKTPCSSRSRTFDWGSMLCNRREKRIFSQALHMSVSIRYGLAKVVYCKVSTSRPRG